jgi:hypothetical protein
MYNSANNKNPRTSIIDQSVSNWPQLDWLVHKKGSKKIHKVEERKRTLVLKQVTKESPANPDILLMD